MTLLIYYHFKKKDIYNKNNKRQMMAFAKHDKMKGVRGFSCQIYLKWGGVYTRGNKLSL